MRLNELSDNAGARRKATRAGRGIGSGLGKTSGRGHKGQKSRSGVALKGFEGGQMPLNRRLPKRGFNNIHGTRPEIVNLGRLQTAVDRGRIDSQKPVTIAILQEAGLVGRARDGVRLLAKGEVSAKLAIEVTGASSAAIAAVEKVGGSVTTTGKAKRKRDRKIKQKAKPEAASPPLEAEAETKPASEAEAKPAPEGVGDEAADTTAPSSDEAEGTDEAN